MVNHNRSTGREPYLSLECRLQLALNLETGKDRGSVLVSLQLLQVVGHDPGHEFMCGVVGVLVINQDLADILTQVVANCTDDDVTLAVDQEWGGLFGRLLDTAPDLVLIVEIPLQLLRGFADPCGTDDCTRPLGDLHLPHCGSELLAILALDSARDATRTRVVGHVDQVASRHADKGGQRGPLVATLLFLNLYDDLLPLTDCCSDGGASTTLKCPLLEVVAGDLLEGEKAVALTAIIDKSGLKAGFDTGDLSLVDVALFLLVGCALDVEVVEVLAIHQRDTQLLLLGCVHQNSFHCNIPGFQCRKRTCSGADRICPLNPRDSGGKIDQAGEQAVEYG